MFSSGLGAYLGRVATAFNMEGVAPSLLSTSGLYIWRDIPYFIGGGVDHDKHKLDIFVPSTGFPRPLMPVCLFVHGGSWQRGDRDVLLGLYSNVGILCARAGMMGVVMSYRLAPNVQYSDQVLDVARALVWLRQHAKLYGGAGDRLGLVGHSAGAHLAMMALCDQSYFDQAWQELGGMTQEQPMPETPLANCFVGISGVYDVERLGAQSLGRLLVEPAFGDLASGWVEGSPLFHVRRARAAVDSVRGGCQRDTTSREPPLNALNVASQNPSVSQRHQSLKVSAERSRQCGNEPVPASSTPHSISSISTALLQLPFLAVSSAHAAVSALHATATALFPLLASHGPVKCRGGSPSAYFPTPPRHNPTLLPEASFYATPDSGTPSTSAAATTLGDVQTAAAPIKRRLPPIASEHIAVLLMNAEADWALGSQSDAFARELTTLRTAVQKGVVVQPEPPPRTWLADNQGIGEEGGMESAQGSSVVGSSGSSSSSEDIFTSSALMSGALQNSDEGNDREVQEETTQSGVKEWCNVEALWRHWISEDEARGGVVRRVTLRGRNHVTIATALGQVADPGTGLLERFLGHHMAGR